MKQLFFEDRALIFSDACDKALPGAINKTFVSLDELRDYALNEFRELPHYSQVCVDCRPLSSEKVFDGLCKKIRIIEAGGGLVRARDGQGRYLYLYIYRNRMWDLPKGKKEAGESREENALREVEEETGLNGIRILRFIGSTYHFVNLKGGEIALKQSNWFEMETDSPQKTIPQTEEGITEALWLDIKEIKERLPFMYASIAFLTENYFGEKS